MRLISSLQTSLCIISLVDYTQHLFSSYTPTRKLAFHSVLASTESGRLPLVTNRRNSFFQRNRNVKKEEKLEMSSTTEDKGELLEESEKEETEVEKDEQTEKEDDIIEESSPSSANGNKIVQSETVPLRRFKIFNFGKKKDKVEENEELEFYETDFNSQNDAGIKTNAESNEVEENAKDDKTNELDEEIVSIKDDTITSNLTDTISNNEIDTTTTTAKSESPQILDSSMETSEAITPKQQPQPPPPPALPINPTSSLIFMAPPPPSISRPLGRPGSGTSSPAEATLTSLISSLLPLVVRLLLVTVLSGSSLFGHGDAYVYSPNPSQHFVLERLNERYQKDNLAMKKALEYPPDSRSKHVWKFALKQRRNEMRKIFKLENKAVLIAAANENPSTTQQPKKSIPYTRTMILLNVHTMGDDMDVVVEHLRDSISYILRQFYDKNDARLDMGKELEVVVCIESPGGVVQDFGLAADQLVRLKEAGKERDDLIVTVCVDKIAASGGYMMACQASPGQLLAAPFSILGSIGVLRETINVHDVLQKYGIRPLMMKAGHAKVPLTSTTEITEENLELVQNNLDRIHDAFRDLVSKARGEAISEENYDKVTSGDVFLGKHAIEYGLVDRIMTSDEYISERINAGDRVLRLHKYDAKRSVRFSPLDLLMLKSNGLLGKYNLRSTFRFMKGVAKFCSAVGLMQLVETKYRHSPLSDLRCVI